MTHAMRQFIFPFQKKFSHNNLCDTARFMIFFCYKFIFSITLTQCRASSLPCLLKIQMSHEAKIPQPIARQTAGLDGPDSYNFGLH
jgi:hypothetical protein